MKQKLSDKTIFNVKVLNWHEKNPTAKIHYKKTLISNSLISDARINALPLSHKWLFINLLLICGDHANDTVTITLRQVNDILTTKEGALNALRRLEEFQLVTIENMPLIEENRIEDNNNKETNVVVDKILIKEKSSTENFDARFQESFQTMMGYLSDIGISSVGRNNPSLLLEIFQNDPEKLREFLNLVAASAKSKEVQKNKLKGYFATALKSEMGVK